MDSWRWLTGPGPASIGDREIHIWKISLEPGGDRAEILRRILSPEEKRRAEGFFFKKDRDSFCICRGYLRRLIGRYDGEAPEGIRFTAGQYGKPSLDPDPHGRRMEFNVSHTQGVALIAIARDRRVGVDVERIRPVEIDDISRGFFSPREHESILGLPAGMRTAAFYACWTRKEAAIKALGGSIAGLLDKVIVSPDPRSQVQVIQVPAGQPQTGELHVRDVPVGGGYSAALCYAGSEAEVFLWQPED
ncbi:MAG TPA: 4'-phosphopantetheinyl transferase superfamily protein [Spirochaetia bacterium]|nr:4'-phosphopantetheinyl transferase superfamily protein [Spirochaetia bacterium]